MPRRIRRACSSPSNHALQLYSHQRGYLYPLLLTALLKVNLNHSSRLSFEESDVRCCVTVAVIVNERWWNTSLTHCNWTDQMHVVVVQAFPFAEWVLLSILMFYCPLYHPNATRPSREKSITVYRSCRATESTSITSMSSSVVSSWTHKFCQACRPTFYLWNLVHSFSERSIFCLTSQTLCGNRLILEQLLNNIIEATNSIEKLKEDDLLILLIPMPYESTMPIPLNMWTQFGQLRHGQSHVALSCDTNPSDLFVYSPNFFSAKALLDILKQEIIGEDRRNFSLLLCHV